MSLAEQLDRLQPAPFRCKYARALAGITEQQPEHVSTFTDAVQDGTLPVSRWAQILTEEGFPVSETVTRKHLGGGDCGCRP